MTAQQYRVTGLSAAFMVAAIPALANNPPRPDGVLYLILVFPLLAVAAVAGGVSEESKGWGARIVRGVLWTFLILLCAAGTEMGLLAMLVIVTFGLFRSVQIVRRGSGARRFAAAVAAALVSVGAGVGYVWALYTTSAAQMDRFHQKRTMADMRTISTGILEWSIDQQELLAADPEATGTTEEAVATEQPAPSPDATPGPEPLPVVSFADGECPSPMAHADLARLLVPAYLRELPETDGWGRPFEIRFDREPFCYQIRSGGADGQFDGASYTVGPFDPLQRERDIVIVDGEFVAWPG